MDYENLLTVIKERRSIRKYKPEPVPIESVMKVLEAARWAPSGRNSQPWEFIVVRDKDKLRQVADRLIEYSERLRATAPGYTRADYLRDATTFIIVCADPRFKAAYPPGQFSEQNERILIQSVSAAVSNILLAACSLGLGAVWISGAGQSITEQQLKEALKIPQGLQIMCCVALGYSDIKQLTPRQPRPLETMVHFDEFDASKLRSDQDVQRFAQDEQVRARFRETGRID